LKNIKQLEKVILVARGPTYSEETGYGLIEKNWTDSPSKYASFFKNPKNYNPEKAYIDSIESSIKYFSENNIQVFFQLENPELGFSPKSCVDRPFGVSTAACNVPLNAYVSRMQKYRSKVSQVMRNYPNVVVLDPQPHLCDAQNCYARLNGHMLYADDDHLSIEGSRYIAEKLYKQVIDK
jgi:hypothetical protein